MMHYAVSSNALISRVHRAPDGINIKRTLEIRDLRVIMSNSRQCAPNIDKAVKQTRQLMNLTLRTFAIRDSRPMFVGYHI